jgi:hypothetical protein
MLNYRQSLNYFLETEFFKKNPTTLANKLHISYGNQNCLPFFQTFG